MSVPGADPVWADVVIFDAGHTGRGRRTVLRLLWTPDDPLAVELLLTAQPEVARGFLGRTEAAVPRGTERSDPALDDLLERLLRRGD